MWRMKPFYLLETKHPIWIEVKWVGGEKGLDICLVINTSAFLSSPVCLELIKKPIIFQRMDLREARPSGG